MGEGCKSVFEKIFILLLELINVYIYDYAYMYLYCIYTYIYIYIYIFNCQYYRLCHQFLEFTDSICEFEHLDADLSEAGSLSCGQSGLAGWIHCWGGVVPSAEAGRHSLGFRVVL